VNGKPVAFTKAGALEGYVMKSIRQRNIYTFEGVPFGESTGGKNRFEVSKCTLTVTRSAGFKVEILIKPAFISLKQ
jgi:carboxylesterase type B